MTEALGIFESLAQSKTPYMAAQADIRVVNATLLLKRYDDMPKLCNSMAERCNNATKAALSALLCPIV